MLKKICKLLYPILPPPPYYMLQPEKVIIPDLPAMDIHKQISRREAIVQDVIKNGINDRCTLGRDGTVLINTEI